MVLNTKYNSGISTIEMLIAFAIMITAISAIVLVAFGNQTIAVDNELNNEALYKAKEIVESARADAREDFNGLAGDTTTDDIYTKILGISDINLCKKRITGNVSWQVDASRLLNIGITSDVANIDEAVALGGDCGSDSPPISDWWFPDRYTSVDFKDYDADNNGIEATSIDVFLKDGSKYAILSTKHTNADIEDAWIFDVTSCVYDDPPSCSPALDGLVDTGPGLNDIDTAGDFAFAANGDNDETGQLHVVDISDTTVPALIATRSLAGVDPAGSYPQGRSIYYYNSRVYIGTAETAGPEFHVFDVSTPEDPIELGNLELTHNVNDIIVRGDYAYLATSDNTGEVMVIDISDPAAMVHPDTTGMKFDAPGDHDGTAIYLLSNKLYLGRRGGDNSPVEDNLFVLDIGNPTAVFSLGSKLIKKNPVQALGLSAMAVSGPFAFLGTTGDSNAEFQVFKIENPGAIENCDEDPPPGTPFDPPGCGKYDFPAKINDIEYHNNLIFSSVESNDAFRIMFDDVSQYP